MSAPTAGSGGSGSVTAYRFAQGQVAAVETLSFTVTTDATAGVHSVRVELVIPTLGTVARLDDLNEAGPSQTNRYTYGLGLNAAACTLPTGIAVTDALPWTQLPPGSTVVLTAINAAGATIASDAFSDVFLMLSDDAQTSAEDSSEAIVLVPGAQAA